MGKELDFESAWVMAEGRLPFADAKVLKAFVADKEAQIGKNPSCLGCGAGGEEPCRLECMYLDEE